MAAHELGHALGLGHEAQQTDLCPLMKPSMTTCTAYRLCQDDIDGVVALYGLASLIPAMTPLGLALGICALSAALRLGRRRTSN